LQVLVRKAACRQSLLPRLVSLDFHAEFEIFDDLTYSYAN
jgi:hypothetical protein